MPGAIALITASTISTSGKLLTKPFLNWCAKLENVRQSFCPGSPIWPDIFNLYAIKKGFKWLPAFLQHCLSKLTVASLTAKLQFPYKV